MRIALRRLGNSQGVIIPKPLLVQAGLEGEVELSFENDSLVLRRPRAHPRAGWADASRKIAEAKDDAPAWPDFANADDADLRW
ncbi:MAG TPA: AbrB/MazE/SpoVT family DNA-binding domain-containing protein [Casimicrobiaceae bacterium]